MPRGEKSEMKWVFGTRDPNITASARQILFYGITEIGGIRNG